jgi:hypothetical protein
MVEVATTGWRFCSACEYEESINESIGGEHELEKKSIAKSRESRVDV